MSDRPYPISLAELESWRLARNITSEEARKRFVQFIVLDMIARAPWVEEVAFKGGNALRYAFGNPRSTIDLDFTAMSGFPDDETVIRTRLDSALIHSMSLHSVKARSQSIHRNPKDARATHPTYDITIAYQFPGDRRFADFERASNIPTVVRVEISLNDLVCDAVPCGFGEGATHTLRVCSLEDIVAEKLRALLQQPIRNRSRPQDVYDIARTCRVEGAALDRAKVSQYLLRKSAIRGVTVARAAFDDSVRRRAMQEYGHLFEATDPHHIPFDEAWRQVLQLVHALDIPA